MPRTTSFTLGDELDAFIQSQVDRGAYSSASEVVRAALKLLAEEDAKERALYDALDQGLASPLAPPGAPERALARVHQFLANKK